MKKVIVIYEGAGDEPLSELDGRTPLQAARCHHACALAAGGRAGMLEPWPSETPWRSEWLLGAMSGVPGAEIGGLHRGPLEAAASGVEPGPDEMVFRGDFVTLDGTLVRDNLAGVLGIEETVELAATLDAAAGADCDVTGAGAGSVAIRFRGIDPDGVRGPATGARPGDDLAEAGATGLAGKRARDLMTVAAEVLAVQPVNEVRVDLGENPASGIWIWGGGAWPRPLLDCSRPPSGDGAMLSASLLGKGIAMLLGFDLLNWPSVGRENGPPGTFPFPDVVRLLRENDHIVVYAQAPLDGGRFGSAVEKVRGLDRLDQEVLGRLREVLDAYRPYRIALIAGGVVSSRTGLAQPRAAPVVLAGEEIEPDTVRSWDEGACSSGGLGSMNAGDLLRRIEDR